MHKLNLHINPEGKLPKKAVEKLQRIFKSKANKNIILSIEDYRKKRSNPQNSFYWGVIVKILSRELGYSEDEIHEILKYKFLGTKEISIDGEKYPVIKSTTKLSTMEFMTFIEEIQRWASEMNIYLPDPNEIIEIMK